MASLTGMIQRQEWEMVTTRINKNPSEASIDPLHLHEACKYDPPISVIWAFIRAVPRLVKETDDIGDLPLHKACCYGADKDVIENLVNMYPESLNMGNRGSQNPLAVAQTSKWTRSSDSQQSVIEFLRKETFPNLFDDDMTGLPRKEAFKKWAHIAPYGDCYAYVVFIDMVGLKYLNDNFGTSAGDEAINKYATSIKEKCRAFEKKWASDKDAPRLIIDVFRVGGDEFVVVLKSVVREEEYRRVWKSIYNFLLPNFGSLKESKYHTFARVGCSAGMVSTSEDAEELRKKAEGLQNDLKAQLKTKRGEKPLLSEFEAKGMSKVKICSELLKWDPFPIHTACQQHLEADVLQEFVELFVGQCKTRDNDGNLPLHIACSCGVSVEVIELLLKAYGGSAKESDELDCLPLHIAAKNGAQSRVLQALVQAYGKAATMTNKTGDLPVHLLDHRQEVNVDDVELLLEPVADDVNACKSVGSSGMLPLHIASKHGVPFDLLEKLLNSYSKAAATVCRDRESPYAIDWLEKLQPKKEKKRESPDSTEDEREQFHRKSDLLFAYHPNIEKYCRVRLQRFVHQIAVDTKKGLLSETSRRVWIWMCTFPEEDKNSDNCASCVKKVLERCSRREVELLASIQTLGPQSIRSLATPICAKEINSRLLFAGRLQLNRDHPLHRSETCLVIKARDFGTSQETNENHRQEPHNNQNVVVKFMSDPRQFDREIGSRNLSAETRSSQVLARPFLVPAATYFDSRLAYKADKEYARDIEESKAVFGHDLLRFPCAIALERGDRNFDYISKHELPSMLKIRGYMEEVATKLAQLHDTGIIHADLKLMNIVRLHDCLTLIDVDASRQIGKDFCGVKFSSGMLPPEMIHELKDEQENHNYETYWGDVVKDFHTISSIIDETSDEVPSKVSESLERDRGAQTEGIKLRMEAYSRESPTFAGIVGTNKPVEDFYTEWTSIMKNWALWKKIRPQRSNNRSFVVKTFGSDRNAALLPYELVRANRSLDIWSFGILLYKLCTKEDLFSVNDNTGDLVNGDGFAELSDWDLEHPSHTEKEKMNHVDNQMARNLLEKLLRKDAGKRPKNMKEILQDGFFVADYKHGRRTLEEKLESIIASVESTRKDIKSTRKDIIAQHIIAQHWDAVLDAVKREPDSARGEVFLLACKYGPTLPVVNGFVTANSDLVQYRGKMNELPLHVVCQYGAEKNVIEFLVSTLPRSLGHVDFKEKTPLDIAQNNTWVYKRDDQTMVIDYLKKKTFPDLFDGMTGLPRSSAFQKWAHIPPPGLSDANIILLFMDISGFKALNDNVSHQVGDDALKKYSEDIAQACEQTAKLADTNLHLVIEVFRVGGDEFVVVAKFGTAFAVRDVWNDTIKNLAGGLAGITVEDSHDPPRYSTFMRIGCSGGNVSNMTQLREFAEGLERDIRQKIGSERGQSISLQQLRHRGIKNSSELALLNE